MDNPNILNDEFGMVAIKTNNQKEKKDDLNEETNLNGVKLTKQLF